MISLPFLIDILFQWCNYYFTIIVAKEKEKMFFVCLFFGYFGIHKFIEKKTRMGVLYLFTVGLFGIGWIYDTITYARNKQFGFQAQSIRKRLEEGEPLPIVDSNLILGENEVCHYFGRVEHRIVKNRVIGHKADTAGVSLRVAKGVTIRKGGAKGAAIRGDVVEKTPGKLTVTNQRIVFGSTKANFEKKLSAITSITPYTDGVEIQFGANAYQFVTPEGEYINDILRRLL